MPTAHNSISTRLHSATRVINWRNVPVMITLGIGALLMLLPFLWMFATSMRPPGEAYKLPPSFLPTRINFDSYIAVLSSPLPFLRMYLNSFLVAVATTIGVIASSSMAAFAFSRLRFPGSSLLFSLMLVGLMVPSGYLLMPVLATLSTMKR